MACPRRCTWTLVLLLAPALAAQAAPAGGGADAPALFATNCAKCHGLDGSGTGPAVLDRPARNFKEGGFSFGNTPETIARTIAFGIPGSPMPAFDTALDEEQRRALAEYVVTLGPPVTEVSEAETLMHVTDRPIVVRGILPPLIEGAHNIPRGLLIGTPDGLTFEYAVDDVRLLAVRQGDFVKRTDWGGRGGTPLEPLGKVVWSDEGQSGAGHWFGLRRRFPGSDNRTMGAGSPLSAKLLSTTTLTDATLGYGLVTEDPDGVATRLLAVVTESVGATNLGEHAGFVRRFVVRAPPHSGETGTPEPIDVCLRLDLADPMAYLVRPGEDAVSLTSGNHDGWWGRQVSDGQGLLLHVVFVSTRCSARREPEGLTVFVGTPQSAVEPIEFEVATFVLDPLAPDVQALLPQSPR